RDAGGSRTRLGLLCRQPPDRLAPASGHFGFWISNFGFTCAMSRRLSSYPKSKNPRSKMDRPRQESNLVYDLRRVACLRHTPRTVPHRGIGPRLAASKAAVLPAHSQGELGLRNGA